MAAALRRALLRPRRCATIAAVHAGALALLILAGCTLHPEGNTESGGAGGAAVSASSAASTGGGDAPTSSAAGGSPQGGAGRGGDGGAPVTCGNQVLDQGEQCDDGNLVSGDGCSSDCAMECSAANQILHPDTFHCYDVSLTERTWQEAHDDCTSVPTRDLAALSPIAEIEFLGPLLSKTQFFWIGGNDLQVEGTFQWSNGEPWLYQDGELPWFAPVEPNNANGNENCVRLLTDGTFNDDDCSSTFNFFPFGSICERPPAGAPAR